MTTDPMREAFYYWWKEVNPYNTLDRDKYHPERYLTLQAQYGWESWQACAQTMGEALVMEISKMHTFGFAGSGYIYIRRDDAIEITKKHMGGE